MSTLNQLSTTSTLTSSDQIILYSTVNGSARKASLATFLEWIESAWMSPAFQRVTASPTLAGFTLALPATANSLFVLLTPTGTMATGTIVLPAAATAADGQEIVLYTSQEVTALTFTLNGATAVGGAPTGIQAGASLTLRYDALSVAWYTIEKPSSVGSGTANFLPKWSAPTTLTNSIVRDNGTEVSIGGNVIAGQKLAVYGSQFNLVTDSDATLTVCNAASTAPRSATVEAANYTDGLTGTAGFRASIARGTLLVPAAVVSGDDLGAFISRAHDGTGFFEAGRIQFDAQSNWAAGRSSSITLSTCAGGIVGDRLYISPTGNVQLATNGTTFIASGTGQGIKLPATPSNIDPNTLDAYDEGTFTPVYNGAGVVGTVTFSCRYQRTGNQVTLELTMAVGAGSSFTYTYATDYFDGIPASLNPTVLEMSTGSYWTDSTFFTLVKSGVLFRTGFLKSGSVSFLLGAGQTRRAQVTYMI